MSELAGLVATSLPRLTVFVLALARLVGLGIMAPILGSMAVPVRVRAGLAFFVTVALLPVLPPAVRDPAWLATPLGLALAVAAEVVVGLLVGLVAQFVFAGAMLGAELAGTQMGLGMAGLVDPQHQSRVTPLEEWQSLVALLVFLSVDGHHLLIRAVAESFRRVPIGGDVLSNLGIGAALVLAGGIFTVGLKIAAPALILILMANAAMGALARLIPQLNVMVVGFPVNVAAGLFALALAQPFAIRFLESSFAGLADALGRVIGPLG